MRLIGRSAPTLLTLFRTCSGTNLALVVIHYKSGEWEIIMSSDTTKRYEKEYEIKFIRSLLTTRRLKCASWLHDTKNRNQLSKSPNETFIAIFSRRTQPESQKNPIKRQYTFESKLAHPEVIETLCQDLASTTKQGEIQVVRSNKR